MTASVKSTSSAKVLVNVQEPGVKPSVWHVPRFGSFSAGSYRERDNMYMHVYIYMYTYIHQVKSLQTGRKQ